MHDAELHVAEGRRRVGWRHGNGDTTGFEPGRGRSRAVDRIDDEDRSGGPERDVAAVFGIERDVPGCRAVRGTVLYVESVDPDGDGDLHVVVEGGSITLPGMTAIDIAPDLRPRRDPRIGDRVSAAGPVQTGSYGQSQIHALALEVRRR